MNIWQKQREISDQLFRINLLNTLIGLWLSRLSGFWRGFGSQAVGWGLINIGIALGGRLLLRRRLKKIDDPNDNDLITKETRSLSRILAINTVLDVFYMLGGQQLADKFGKSNDVVRGHGWGIVIQGLALFLFDLFHLRELKNNSD